MKSRLFVLIATTIIVFHRVHFLFNCRRYLTESFVCKLTFTKFQFVDFLNPSCKKTGFVIIQFHWTKINFLQLNNKIYLKVLVRKHNSNPEKVGLRYTFLKSLSTLCNGSIKNERFICWGNLRPVYRQVELSNKFFFFFFFIVHWH